MDTSGTGVKATVKTSKGEEILEADILLSAVGIKTNIENIGLEDVGIATDRDKILVNDYYQTNIPGYYAIGDVTAGPALAHVASAEGILCVEKIAGMHVEPLDYGNIPGCTYCMPEIASVGLTEKQAIEKGYDIKIGKFPFSASGKAKASGNADGFVKVIFDAKYGEWLGCHMIGAGGYRHDCRSSRRPEIGNHRARNLKGGTPSSNYERGGNGSSCSGLWGSYPLVITGLCFISNTNFKS